MAPPASGWISLLSTAFLVVVTACKSDPNSKTVDTVDQGTTRAVVCGKDTCQNDDYCCGSNGWGDAACAVDCAAKNAIFCDDATDCPEDSVCCYIEANNSVTSTECLASCPMLADRGQLCHVGSTECPTGTTCKALAVAPGGLSGCATSK